MRILTAASFCLSVLTASLAHATTPPKQNESGPGGADYAISTADVAKEALGAGAQQVFVFSSAKDAAGARPVVVFLHAYGAYNPKIYGAWIDHLVRKGHIVIFPRYQADARTPRPETLGHAAVGIKTALEKLGARADTGKVAYVGHAAGGIMAANLAAGAGGTGVPPAKLVFSVMPANSKGSTRLGTPLVDMAKMPDSVMLLTLAGESDNVARDADARRLIRETVNVAPARKMLFKMPTDSHGSPSLFATHVAPMAANDAYDMDSIPVAAGSAPVAPVPAPAARGRRGSASATSNAPAPQPEQFGAVTLDAVDYGLWKILDIAMPFAFAGQDTTPVKNFKDMTAMGQWSDGWPVKRIAFESAREPKPEDVKPAPTAPSAIQPKRPAR